MRLTVVRLYCAVLFAAAFAIVANAQETEKLKVYVYPDEAYTFVDGKAIGPGNRTIKLPLGTHNLVVANYGFKFFQQDVALDSGKPTVVKVNLEPSGNDVSGPFGRIQLELGILSLGDAGDHAVLLNGKTANYFVGHIDEFNNNIGWHQELVVPPGNHQVTVTRRGQEVWAGTIAVAPNQRVIVNISNGDQKIKDWSKGSEIKSLPRFTAGMATTTIAIAPVSSEISANPSKIDCGQPSLLKWTSAETIDADISGMSPVPVSGDKTVSPKQTTAYDFTATGPGGVTKSTTTVDVNTAVQSSLTVSPPDAHYRKIGDKIITSGDATLTWSTSNADAASLTPFGSVDTHGTKVVPMTPTQTSDGPVEETFKYTLTATNACGGTEARTTAVHISGSIEPIPEVLLKSVFFPTEYPTKTDPSVGLLKSQQDSLTALAAGFTKYLEYDPGAKLTLSAYADQRGANTYNQDLSERRVQRVREFLVSQGIADDKIEASAFGDAKQLEKSTVIELQTQNPEQPPETRVQNFRTTWLAYNRRVDVVLLPTNRESLKFFPNASPDSQILWQIVRPPLSEVQQNQ